MTATTATVHSPQRMPTAPAAARWHDPRVYAPTIFAIVNAVAFYVLRPGVSDLWAARARASAAAHGVGLGYWFDWFGGGSTPGNYSIVTPYLSAAIGTELVGALSAVAITILVTVLVRDTPHATAAATAGAIAVALNLWSGRIPFLLGGAAAVAALIAVRRRHRTATVGLTLLSIAASPLAGAFIVLGLSGTFLTTRTKDYRPIIAYAAVAAAIAIAASTVAFGAPGPEPFSDGLLLELVLGFTFLWLAGAPDHLRTTLWVTMLAALALWAVPNGVGANLARFVWYCLPVGVLALSRHTTRIAALAVTPLLVIGAVTTATDLYDASQPVASRAYYTSLVTQIDRLPDVLDYRIEVVDHGSRAGDDALLGHAWLARGWETQEDYALNEALYKGPLDPVTYKLWLDNNAVGYVALPSTSFGSTPEYSMLRAHVPNYLHRVWRNDDWQLFHVQRPTPIVGRPAAVLAHDAKSLTLDVPRAGRLAVRIRWSKFLSAVRQQQAPAGKGLVDARPLVRARVVDDGSGWTVLHVRKPGVYMLRGSLRGLLH